jgi:hypothetical protein
VVLVFDAGAVYCSSTAALRTMVVVASVALSVSINQWSSKSGVMVTS